jgi:hypothetical protein
MNFVYELKICIKKLFQVFGSLNFKTRIETLIIVYLDFKQYLAQVLMALEPNDSVIE